MLLKIFIGCIFLVRFQGRSTLIIDKSTMITPIGAMEALNKNIIECIGHLVPNEDEPSVCLMQEWVNLPMA